MLTELLYSATECCKESRNERFSKFIIYHIIDPVFTSTLSMLYSPNYRNFQSINPYTTKAYYNVYTYIFQGSTSNIVCFWTY